MAVNVNWQLLGPPVDVAGSVQRGIEHGRQARVEGERRNALVTFASDPSNPAAVNALMAVDPALGFRARDYQRGEEEAAREAEFRGGMSDYLLAQGGGRSPIAATAPAGVGQPASSVFGPPASAGAAVPGNALVPASPVAPSPLQPDAALASSPMTPGGAGSDTAPDPNDYRAAIDQQHAAFQRMAKADPVKAMAAQREFYTLAKGRLDTMHALYSDAYQELAGVADEDGYQRVLGKLQTELEPMGVDIRSVVPPTFPGDKGIRELRYRALDAKDQLVAADRYMRLQWDIDDDEEDNARADRNTESVIGARGASAAQGWSRVGIAREGMARTDARGRRGQDIASADRRRGQDLASQRPRAAPGERRGGSPAGAAGPRVATNPKTGERVQWSGAAWVPAR